MYTLLHGFYKYLAEKDEYCVLILGLDDAGKTVTNYNILKSIFKIDIHQVCLCRLIWKRQKRS